MWGSTHAPRWCTPSSPELTATTPTTSRASSLHRSSLDIPPTSSGSSAKLATTTAAETDESLRNRIKDQPRLSRITGLSTRQPWRFVRRVAPSTSSRTDSPGVQNMSRRLEPVNAVTPQRRHLHSIRQEWRNLSKVLRRITAVSVAIGCTSPCIGVLLDLEGKWRELPFLTNLYSAFTSAAFGLPLVLVVLAALASHQNSRAARLQAKRALEQALHDLSGAIS